MTAEQVAKRAIEALDLVGTREIAERAGVSKATVNDWRYRLRGSDNPFPEAELTLSGVPGWRWQTIEAWLDKTGRTS